MKNKLYTMLFAIVCTASTAQTLLNTTWICYDPSNVLFNILYDDPGHTETTLKVTNAMREMVIEESNIENIKKESVDLSRLPHDVYFMTLQNKNGEKVIRAIR